MTSPLLTKPATTSQPRELATPTLWLDRHRGAPPMIDQLVCQLRRSIEDRQLPPEARLPASRALARELGVSRTVVTEAYAILISEGYLDSRRGSGTFVVHQSPSRPSDPPSPKRTPRQPRWLRRPVEAPAIDPSPAGEAPTGEASAGELTQGALQSFRLCDPDPNTFPDAAWRTCARAVLTEPFPDGYADPAGDLGLRRAIAAFLRRERGLPCSAERILITSGTTQSLDLIARATLAPGDRVGFEDPGYRLARQIFDDHGAQLLPIPVDEQGLQVEALGESDPPKLVYTTPSHQFPVGSLLSYHRRSTLLDWARRHEALIIEDDYDSELRLEGPALPALVVGSAPDSVVYLGTFSKVLAPSLRIGYLIAPEPLRQALVRLKVRADHHTHWPTQRALARYLERGAFGRHLRRMRRLYRERRDHLVAALAPLPEGARWIGLAAGLHATLLLPSNLEARSLVDFCRQRGVLLRTLADYSLQPPTTEGLVLGFGACSKQQLEAMAAVVHDALWQADTDGNFESRG